MAGSRYPLPSAPPPPLSMGGQVAVINPQFCAPYPVDLTIVRKLMTLSEDKFAVTDVNGNIMFKIKGKLFSFRHRRVLLDAAGHPVITFQHKRWSLHRRWQAFRGESHDPKDLLFSVKLSSLFQFRTQLDVFLASNTKEEVCDFKIKSSWFERSCVIYTGESTTVIAQMHKKHSVSLGKDRFGVAVYPNVDCAFIVALVVILEEINSERRSDSANH